MDPKTYELLRNQTLLFFIEKLIDIDEENRKRTLHDLSCQFGSKGFTKEMRQIAGGSQSGLKKFLGEYPSIFQIENDLVMYKDTSYGGTKRDSSSEIPAGDIGKEAVEYFRERMIQYGIGVWVPIKSLLGHRSQAPPHLRHVSGQHLEEFRNFLLKFPSTFKLNEDSVLLKEFEQLDDESGNPTNKSYAALPQQKIDKERILKLIEFYGSCLQERGPMLVEQLFHVSSTLINEDNVCCFKTPNDLRSFFHIHSQCFQVHNSMVTLSDSYKVGLEYLKTSTVLNATSLKKPNLNEVNVSVKKPIFTIKSEPLNPLTLSDVPPTNTNTTNTNQNTSHQTQTQTSTSNSPESKDPKDPPTATTNSSSRDSNAKPTLRSRVSEILMKTLTENTQKDQRRVEVVEITKNFEELIDDQESLRNLLANKTQIISNTRKGKQIIDELLAAETIVGLDCEGVNLGDINGKITLIQISLCKEIVFIFDVLTQPGLVFELKRLLECEGITKVMHDCRNDSANLHREFGITLTSVFDTQAAHVVLGRDSNKIKNISLNNLCACYGLKVCNPFKEKIKATYRHDNRYWSRRPLTKQMTSYAACDVLCLVPYLYNEMGKLVEREEDKQLLRELTEEQILALIQPDEIRQRRRVRKNEADLKELKIKIEMSLGDERAIVLSNREMRLLKHLELSELAKEKLKSSLKVAKKLEKMEKPLNHLQHSENLSSETSSEFTSLEYNNNEQLENKFDSIDALINGIIPMISDSNSENENNNCGTPFGEEKASQTHSTGDIVVMKVYEET